MLSKLNKMQAALFCALLPILTGCQGGGSASAVDSLFGGGSTASLASGSGAGGASLIAGEGAATITNPEPTTMLLLGGGMVAMAYFKNKK